MGRSKCWRGFREVLQERLWGDLKLRGSLRIKLNEIFSKVVIRQWIFIWKVEILGKLLFFHHNLTYRTMNQCIFRIHTLSIIFSNFFFNIFMHHMGENQASKLLCSKVCLNDWINSFNVLYELWHYTWADSTFGYSTYNYFCFVVLLMKFNDSLENVIPDVKLIPFRDLILSKLLSKPH